MNTEDRQDQILGRDTSPAERALFPIPLRMARVYFPRSTGEFIERYNLHWRLEKLGYQTPFEARKEHELRQAA